MEVKIKQDAYGSIVVNGIPIPYIEIPLLSFHLKKIDVSISISSSSRKPHTDILENTALFCTSSKNYLQNFIRKLSDIFDIHITWSIIKPGDLPDLAVISAILTASLSSLHSYFNEQIELEEMLEIVEAVNNDLGIPRWWSRVIEASILSSHAIKPTIYRHKHDYIIIDDIPIQIEVTMPQAKLCIEMPPMKTPRGETNVDIRTSIARMYSTVMTESIIGKSFGIKELNKVDHFVMDYLYELPCQPTSKDCKFIPSAPFTFQQICLRKEVKT
ncbi:MAG: hypothetical protein F7C32_04145 [Desulfurococcales archaeon]|nr:hypothetical protein [Desulfurococcales archaeon]